MLLVNAKKGPSSIHGMGLIAQEFIPEGSAVWEFMPGFDVAIPEAALASLSPAAREQVLYYAFLDREARAFILSSDDDRFTNHVAVPNTRSEESHRTVAARDIQAGEEITADYREINMVTFPRDEEGRPDLQEMSASRTVCVSAGSFGGHHMT